MFSNFVHTLKNKLKSRQVSLDEMKVWQEFQQWFTTALGQRLAQKEKEILDKYLPDLFGYYLVQCGCPEIMSEMRAGNWLQSSRVSSRFCLDYVINQGVSCQASLAYLPLKSDSIDIVILPHVLEYSSEPHQVLREVERVLIAEGHVIILGFNPWSFWNLFRYFYFWNKPSPWNGQFLASSRVSDWLALLGFDVVQREGYFYQLPIQSKKIIKNLGFFEKLGQRLWPSLGAGYVMVARKRVETLTPIRPRWRSKQQVVAGGFEPINRNKF